MPFEWIAAVRFLREGRMQSLLIIVGVGVGVAVIVFMSALLSGLQANLIKRTLSSQAHITLLPPEEIARPQQATDTTALRLQKQAQRLRAIDQWQTLRDRLETWPEIAAVSPLASGPAFAVRGEANKAITVLGIEPERYNRVISLAERLTAGQLRVGAGEAVIGIELAKDLGAEVGDKLRLSAAGLPELFLDASARAWHADASLKSLSAWCLRSVAPGEIEELGDGAFAKAVATLPQHPFARLVWLAHLVRGSGTLDPALDPQGLYRLTRWAQTEREFPKHFRIATVMLKEAATVEDIAARSGAPAGDVADFINACHATGSVEQEQSARPSEEGRRGGFFGRGRKISEVS